MTLFRPYWMYQVDKEGLPDMRKVLTTFSHPSGKRVDVYLIGRRYHAETVSSTGKIIKRETFDDTLALDSYLKMIAGDGYQETRP